MRSVSRTPICPICEQRTGVDSRLILLRVGCRKISSKPNRGEYFHPDEFEDGDNEKIYHLYCMQTVGFDFADANEYNNPMRCVFCEDILSDEPIYYELEVGSFDLYDSKTIWVPSKDGDSNVCRVYSCWGCMHETMSEGRENTARIRLGMDEIEETTEIEYGKVLSAY